MSTGLLLDLKVRVTLPFITMMMTAILLWRVHQKISNKINKRDRRTNNKRKTLV